MSRVIILGRGNKRRIRQIRWTTIEVITATLLLLGMLILVVLLGLWLPTHPLD